ncbi:hypothetical protein [Bacillus toyonensis]|nr:hypothetical protein [Bacillus toyonensis]
MTCKTNEINLDNFVKIMDVVYETLEGRQEIIRIFIKLSQNEFNALL